MKKLLFSVLLVCVVSTAAVATYKQGDITARLIRYSDFDEIQEDVFVSPKTTAAHRLELVALIEDAKLRITKIFGAYSASPVIISVRDSNIRKKYSGNSYADAILLPLSARKAYLVIGENGHSIDLIAHELMHAEVFHRVGYWNQVVELPVWFSEGVAMQVDYRERYDNSPANRTLEKLESGWQFFSGTDDELTQHYSIAKEEVNSWLRDRGRYPLYEVLERIDAGENFSALYSCRGEGANMMECPQN